MGRAANRKKHQREVNVIDFPDKFLRIGRPVLDCPKFHALTPHARMLLFDFISQWNGFNNGDLSASFRMLKSRGWKSSATLNRAIEELLCAGFIARTRYGWRNRCALFGLTFASLTVDQRKLDPELVAVFPGDRKRFKPPYQDPQYRPDAQLKSPAVRCHKKNPRFTSRSSSARTDSPPVAVGERPGAAATPCEAVGEVQPSLTASPREHLSSKPSAERDWMGDHVPVTPSALADGGKPTAPIVPAEAIHG